MMKLRDCIDDILSDKTEFQAPGLRLWAIAAWLHVPVWRLSLAGRGVYTFIFGPHRVFPQGVIMSSRSLAIRRAASYPRATQANALWEDPDFYDY